MAISDTLTSIEEHLQADYNSIEKLGIDLTNVNKNIENIASLIDIIYNKFPKIEGEGSSITLSPTLKGKLDYENNIVGYGDTKQGELPSTYQQVEYIESNGAQYINTNIRWVDTNKMVAKIGTDAERTNNIIFGASGSSQVWIGFSNSNTMGGSNAFSNLSITPTTTLSSYTTIGEKTITYTTTYTNTIEWGTYTNSSYQKPNRIAYLKIYNTSNTLVRDMIPCYRVSDNVIGMYDLVSNTFFTNAGSGTFTKGSNTPTPDTPIDIEVVTGTQEVTISNGDNTETQTQIVSLGDIELCKIGVAQDYLYKSNGKWYKKEYVGKIASYNGETITTDYISTTGQLTTGATIYYVKTATDIEITNETLIEQLDNLEKMYSYNSTTNIEVVGNLPMILNVSALKGE